MATGTGAGNLTVPFPRPRSISCDVVAVVVALRDSPRLRAAIASVRASATDRAVRVVCVLNDPGLHGHWEADGVRFVGGGMNLGWAAGVHAGLLGTESAWVWAIQDDLIVEPDALERLTAALDADASLASVRPLPVDASGVVEAGSCGGLVDSRGRWSSPIPPRPAPASSCGDVPVGSYLPSSGQLIRRAAWDQVGGFDPWFYPWGYIDIDFGRTLHAAGWGLATVPAARMRHATRGSTTTAFRWLCSSRNRVLFEGKWSAGDPPPSALISPAIVRESRASRARPRDLDLAGLQRIAGVSAADLAVVAMRWSSPSAMTRAARTVIGDRELRQEVVDKTRRAVLRRWRR